MKKLLLLFFISGMFSFVWSQEESNKALHSDGGGWGLKIVQPEGEKSVLLIGNSICNGYKGYVARELHGCRVIAWVSPYNLKSEHLYDDLITILKSEKWDAIHFNIGLHGWEKGQIPEGMYQPLLQSMVDTLKYYAPESKLIWASITPITSKEKPYTTNKELNPIIADRNLIAGIVMKNNEIPVDDLYSLCLLNLHLARGDRFHWTAPMYRMMAIQVAEKIKYFLK
ncbi:MAG: SGNH/GDSL hydrolase family protein [Chlorobi bacterium]|nr:SGNH/GDSL hydrolase family protein [Chlorobiota bacterium]